ncbi:hypothetical protein SNE40_018328 [Patella caerulea]|uniref:Tyr recombinase domain-containing protein n=1 Tax=Patella caerulea TaxID=87958 RepID=A0AAN8J9E3_PATCE
MYSKSPFVGLRAAIHRHLRAPPYEQNINILSDREFHSSNNVFLSVIRKLKKEGLDKSSHHMSISDGDMIKIRQYLSSLSPNNLLYKVWFDLMLGFASRGNENQRSFDKDTFVISTDDTGLRYIYQSRIYITKNHRGDLNDSVESKRRIYATGGLNCPVSSFELYISKLNPGNTCLFQSPKKHVQFEDAIWYNNKPLGTTTLKCMMKTISKSAGLTNTYTNHCVRATAINLLSHAGVEVREICKLTGHKNEQSLSSYNFDSSSKQKRIYSSILQGCPQTVSRSLPLPSPSFTSTSASSPEHFQSLESHIQFQSVGKCLQTSGLFSITESTVTVNNYFK